MSRTTIRIPEDKINVYREFYEMVKEDLHSDICYVTVELWEAFLNAMKQKPKPPIEMKFAKQNVQINMGCNFYYAPSKPRRELTPELALNKNYFFPLLIEEWKTLKPEAQVYWRKRLEEAGIIEKPKEVRKRRKKRRSIQRRKKRGGRVGLMRRILRVPLAILKKVV